jgi:uncharacterized membrane protein
MDRDRLTAFTDGVLAVIITIMVLEMKAPHGAGLEDLFALRPVFMSYVLSFIYVGTAAVLCYRCRLTGWVGVPADADRDPTQ